MANSRSARKRIRANERKHVRNRAVRSAVRTKVTKARRALLGIDEAIDTQEQLRSAVSALDRAAEKGILHRNNAARRKSRLMVLAGKLAAAASTGSEAQSAIRAAATGGQKGRSGRGTGSAKTKTATTASAAKPAAAKTGRTATKAAESTGAVTAPKAAPAKSPRAKKA